MVSMRPMRTRKCGLLKSPGLVPLKPPCSVGMTLQMLPDAQLTEGVTKLSCMYRHSASYPAALVYRSGCPVPRGRRCSPRLRSVWKERSLGFGQQARWQAGQGGKQTGPAEASDVPLRLPGLLGSIAEIQTHTQRSHQGG